MRTMVKWKVDEAVEHLNELQDTLKEMQKDKSGIKPTTIKWLAGEIRIAIEMLGGIDEQDIIDAQQEKNRDYALDNTRGTWTSEQSRRKEK